MITYISFIYNTIYIVVPYGHVAYKHLSDRPCAAIGGGHLQAFSLAHPRKVFSDATRSRQRSSKYNAYRCSMRCPTVALWHLIPILFK